MNVEEVLLVLICSCNLDACSRLQECVALFSCVFGETLNRLAVESCVGLLCVGFGRWNICCLAYKARPCERHSQFT